MVAQWLLHRVEMAIGWLLGWVDWPLDGRGGYWVGWNWVDEIGVTDWLEKPFCWWVGRQVDVIAHYEGDWPPGLWCSQQAVAVSMMWVQ